MSNPGSGNDVLQNVWEAYLEAGRAATQRPRPQQGLVETLARTARTRTNGGKPNGSGESQERRKASDKACCTRMKKGAGMQLRKDKLGENCGRDDEVYRSRSQPAAIKL
jgi:hypothetical protein